MKAQTISLFLKFKLYGGKSMKRFQFILLLAGILTLAACSGGGNNSEADGDFSSESENSDAITAWAWDKEFNVAALEVANEAYDGDEDIELEIIENAQDDIVQKLNTSLSSGSDKGLPNLVMIEDYRAQNFLESYPDAFYPVDDYMNPDDFSDYKMATTQHDGKQYGVPFDSGTTGLFVRTDILDDAGYSVEDLEDITWKEYIEIGKDIKEETGVDLLTLDPNDLGQIRMMIQSAGEWYTDEDGEQLNLSDNDALKEAFEIYKEMMDSDAVKVISDFSQFIGAANKGDVATVPTGNWFIASVKGEESQEGDWAVVPTPRLESVDSENASNLGGSSIYVLNIDGKEKAASFLENTFGTDEEMYDTLVSDVGAIGTYTPSLDGDAFKEEDEFFDDQAIIEDFAEWNEQIPGVNYGLYTYEIEDIMINKMQDYLNGEDLEDTLEDAQLQAENQIN